MCRRSASLFVACCRIAPRNGRLPCSGTRPHRTMRLVVPKASQPRLTGSFASSVGPAATRKSRRRDQRYEPGEARGAGGTQNGSSFSLTIGNDGKPPKSGFRLVRQSDRVCRSPWPSIIGFVQHFRGAIENHVFHDRQKSTNTSTEDRSAQVPPNEMKPRDSQTRCLVPASGGSDRR